MPDVHEDGTHVTPDLTGSATFGFHHAVRRARACLQRAGLHDQIARLPKAYPAEPGQTDSIDITARAKILKAHLRDALHDENISVKTIRKARPAVCIRHNTTQPQLIRHIARLYVDEDGITVQPTAARAAMT